MKNPIFNDKSINPKFVSTLTNQESFKPFDCYGAVIFNFKVRKQFKC